ncbi:MAG: hypothetical protein Q9204_008977, partial [Flavoplaca sp. TL-2023a]
DVGLPSPSTRTVYLSTLLNPAPSITRIILRMVRKTAAKDHQVIKWPRKSNINLITLACLPRVLWYFVHKHIHFDRGFFHDVSFPGSIVSG